MSTAFIFLSGLQCILFQIEIHFSLSLCCAATQQMAIAMAGHPFCTRKMTVKRTASAIGLKSRVNMQDKTCDFLPVRVVGIGVEHTQISDEVFLVIGRQHRLTRRQVRNAGIERWSMHERPTMDGCVEPGNLVVAEPSSDRRARWSTRIVLLINPGPQPEINDCGNKILPATSPGIVLRGLNGEMRLPRA